MEGRLPSAARERLAQRLRELEHHKIPVLQAQYATSADPDVAAVLAMATRERDRIVDALQSPGASAKWNPRYIEVGDSVTIREIGSRRVERYTLVPSQAGRSLEDGWTSSASPLGSSLVGRAPGEVIDVSTPGGVRRYQIIHFEEG